jgi:hypothetical protein
VHGNQILATCPITDSMGDMHKSHFGVWNSDSNCIDKVPGFCDEVVSPGDFFSVSISSGCIMEPADNFSALFRHAAERYPFVHMPDTNMTLQIPAGAAVRRAVLPIPTELRVAGALTSAEVGGHDTGKLVGSDVIIKRAFVDFIFVYKYDGSLSAKVCRIRETGEECGCIEAHRTSNPRPHLIFDIFPTTSGMAMMYPGCCKVNKSGNPVGLPDRSAQKLHASTTFDLLRRSLQDASAGSTPCVDIALYHSQDDMAFDCGDVGLSECELGLTRRCKEHAAQDKVEPLNTQLPSCAGGGVAGGGG